MGKIYSDTNVDEAARGRIREMLNSFDHYYVSFSGGKDSGVLLNLVIEEAKKLGRLPVNTLFVDLEAQYKHSIDYVAEELSRAEVNPYWICLPLSLRNSVSQLQPKWVCWDIQDKSLWVRHLPQLRGVISDPDFFDFFEKGMEFEEFAPKFGRWLANLDQACCFVGIRADESLNRWRTIASKRKSMFSRHPWTTVISENLVNAYPIYDWRTKDIWIANQRNKWRYNHVYDLMFMAGLSIHKMRLCQPYGDSQRKGLHLFKMLEHESWAKVVNRVEGANFGSRYSSDIALGNRKILLPPGHSWKSYTKFLLDTMPPPLARHYREKFYKTLVWWRKNWRTMEERNKKKYPELWGKQTIRPIYDSFNPALENKRAVLSWRRFAKVILKNDYWCTGLSFSQTRKSLERKAKKISEQVRF